MTEQRICTLNMLRADTSPVQDRLKRLKELAFPGKIQFSACNNTKQGMEKAEGHAIPVLADATIVPSGFTAERLAVKMSEESMLLTWPLQSTSPVAADAAGLANRSATKSAATTAKSTIAGRMCVVRVDGLKSAATAAG